MKKIYQIPEMVVQRIAPATLIAESLPKDGGSGNELSEDDILVKEQREQREGRGHYNVWDDDWREE